MTVAAPFDLYSLEDIPLEGTPRPSTIPPPRLTKYPSQPGFAAIREPPEQAASPFALDEALFREILAHQPTTSVGVFGLDLRYVLAGGETLSRLGLVPATVTGAYVGELSGSTAILDPECQRVLDTGEEVFLRGVCMRDEWFDIDIFPIRRGGVVVGGVMVSRNLAGDRSR